MMLEIDGIKITDESQAEALLAQGFISNDEFNNASRQFRGKGLEMMSDTIERNSPSTIIGKVVKKVQEALKL